MFILFASFEPKLESGRQPLAVWRFNQIHTSFHSRNVTAHFRYSIVFQST